LIKLEYGDGIIDVRYFDENENGVPERKISKMNYQGQDFILVSFDEDTGEYEYDIEQYLY
jgi:hypothetical protein